MLKNLLFFSFSKFIFFLCLTFSSLSFSNNLSVNVSGSSIARSTTSIFTSSDAADYQSNVAARPNISASWTLEEEKAEFVLIGVDGITIPIRIKEKSVTAVSNHFGNITYTENEIRSATRSSVLSIDYKSKDGADFTNRPTLFVSLCGASFNGQNDDECNNWQGDIQTEILKVDYQSKHFAVNWRSNANLFNQVKDLNRLISNFLRNKNYKWDVVLLGFSRGGIFAHEVSKYLVSNDNINKLHTFLLDPTSAGNPILDDEYPASLPQGSLNTHYGSLFYDSVDFTSDNLLLDSLVTLFGNVTDDQNIPGYTNYNRSNFYFYSPSHSQFHTRWLQHEFDQALDDILSHKTNGSYEYDGHAIADSGTDIVRISNESIDIAFDLNIFGGGIQGSASICIEFICTNSDISISNSEIYANASIYIASAQAIINKDMVSASANIFGTSVSASIDSNEAVISTNIFNIEGHASISFDSIQNIGASVQIGSFEIELTVSDVVSGASDVVSGVEDFAHNTLSSGVSVVESGIKSIAKVFSFW